MFVALKQIRNHFTNAPVLTTLLGTLLSLFCDLSVSYLISLKRLLFALDGSLNSERNFFVCTWVYLAVLDWMDGPLNASLLRVPLCGASKSTMRC